MKRLSASLLVGFVSLLGWLNPSGNCVYAQYDDCSVSCTASAPSLAVVGTTVSFSASAVALYCNGQPTYAWGFGNGQTSTSQNPTVTYQSAGTYTWSVSATVQGIAGSQTGTIRIVGPVASVSAASYDASGLGSDSIAAAFGANLATDTQVGGTLPLPTELAGVRVQVKDVVGTERWAPLFFVSPGQINYQVPPGTPTGTATILVMKGSEVLAQGDASIATTAAGIFSADSTGKGAAAAQVLRVKSDGTQLLENTAEFDTAQGKFVSRPIDLGPATDTVFLILFGTGIRHVGSLSAITASVGGTSVEVIFAGPQGFFVGLDQTNIRLARSLVGRGEVDVVLIVAGKPANVVKIRFQ